MAEFKHMRASVSGEAPCSADDWVEAAAEWAEHITHLKATFPMPFTKCVYAEGHKKGQYPLTRLVHVDKSKMPPEAAAATPDIFQETLLRVDKQARVLFYQIDGEPMGMRNYYANKEVDAIDANKCRVTISARLDIPKAVPEEALAPTFQAVYASLIAGIADYALSKKKKAAE